MNFQKKNCPVYFFIMPDFNPIKYMLNILNYVILGGVKMRKKIAFMLICLSIIAIFTVSSLAINAQSYGNFNWLNTGNTQNTANNTNGQNSWQNNTSGQQFFNSNQSNTNSNQNISPVVTPIAQNPTTSANGNNSTPAGGKFHVFLLLGQSNMAGYPKAQESDKVKNDRILALGYDNNQWAVAVPPLHENYQGAIGPGDWFAKTLIQKLPAGDTIGLVPCAISGEKIETFMKSGGSKYNWIISRAKSAQQKGGIIDGILFHQGESNNGDTSWPNKVNTLVEDLKKDLGIGDIPFIAGELLYSGGCAGHNTLVNKLPSVVKNCSVVSASGLTVDPSDTQWKLHFGHDSQVEFGKRYAEKMIQALKW